ncbi:unnamed protein product [Vitrella brassicaformis CCMP3155]|uniref:Uncharacterized protein n=8 Tax=Vitrella brassicaformis TaxID=1169539 RepID=A0A0G4FHF3_VITBC|nr:unnamed protein product [Vitrella brassicaformis CCMP3155]|eukprot:CEM12939.1 unnamed protein product [Vitrella brassicaformis CCMP3155]
MQRTDAFLALFAFSALLALTNAAPSVTISLPEGNVTNQQSVPIDFRFSEPVRQFNDSATFIDLKCKQCSIDLTELPDGRSFSATLNIEHSETEDDLITVTLTDAVTDLAGNPLEPTNVTIAFSGAIEIELLSDPALPLYKNQYFTNGATVTAILRFDTDVVDAVISFQNGLRLIEPDGTTVSSQTPVFSSEYTDCGEASAKKACLNVTYTVLTEGLWTVELPKDSVADMAGNQNDKVDIVFSVDRTGPVPRFYSLLSDVGLPDMSVSVNFQEKVTGVTVDDFTFTGPLTYTNLAVKERLDEAWTFSFDATNEGSTTIGVVCAGSDIVDVAGNPCVDDAESSINLTYNSSILTFLWEGGWDKWTNQQTYTRNGTFTWAVQSFPVGIFSSDEATLVDAQLNAAKDEVVFTMDFDQPPEDTTLNATLLVYGDIDDTAGITHLVGARTRVKYDPWPPDARIEIEYTGEGKDPKDKDLPYSVCPPNDLQLRFFFSEDVRDSISLQGAIGISASAGAEAIAPQVTNNLASPQAGEYATEHTYTVHLAPGNAKAINGFVDFILPEGSVSDRAGNSNRAENKTLFIDGVNPDCALSLLEPASPDSFVVEAVSSLACSETIKDCRDHAFLLIILDQQGQQVVGTETELGIGQHVDRTETGEKLLVNRKLHEDQLLRVKKKACRDYAGNRGPAANIEVVIPKLPPGATLPPANTFSLVKNLTGPGGRTDVFDIDMETVTDDIDAISDPDGIAESEITRSADVLFEDLPPDLGSAFSLHTHKLYAAVTLASTAKYRPDEIPEGRPRPTGSIGKGEEDGDPVYIMARDLFSSLIQAYRLRTASLTEVPISSAEALLSAKAVETAVDLFESTTTFDVPSGQKGAEIFDLQVDITRQTVESWRLEDWVQNVSNPRMTPVTLSQKERSKIRQAVETSLTSAASLGRQIGGLPATVGPSETATLTRNIGESTGRLGDSSLYLLGDPESTLEVSGSKLDCQMALRVVNTSSRLALNISGTNVSVAVPNVTIPVPSAKSSRRLRRHLQASQPPQCASQLSTPSGQLIWWRDGLYSGGRQDDTAAVDATVESMLNKPQRELETSAWEGKGGTLTAAARYCDEEVPLQLQRTEEPIVLHIPRPNSDSNSRQGTFGDEYGVVKINGRLEVMNTTQAMKHGRPFIITTQLACGYFDYATQQWSTAGCYQNTSLTTADTIVCECYHLSDFSVVFSTVIRDSSFASVIAESQEALKRLADTREWEKNVAARFILFEVAIMLLFLVLAVWWDRTHKMSDDDLMDMWMTDPLLDSRFRMDQYMRRQRKRWLGPVYRCCGACWDGLACRFCQAVCNRLSGRQPTLHLTELRAIRRMRQQIVFSLRKGDDLRRVADGYGKLHDSKDGEVLDALAAASLYRGEQDDLLPIGSSKSAKWRATPRKASSMLPKSRRSIIFNLKSSVPSLPELVFNQFHDHLERNRLLAPPAADPKKDDDNAMMSPATRSVVRSPPQSGSDEAAAEQSPRRRVRRSHDEIQADTSEGEGIDTDLSPTHTAEAEPEVYRGDAVEQTQRREWVEADAQLPAREHKISDRFPLLRCCRREGRVDLISTGVLREAIRSRLLLQVQRQQAAAVLIQRWWSKVLAARPVRQHPTFLSGRGSVARSEADSTLSDGDRFSAWKTLSRRYIEDMAARRGSVMSIYESEATGRTGTGRSAAFSPAFPESRGGRRTSLHLSVSSVPYRSGEATPASMAAATPQSQGCPPSAGDTDDLHGEDAGEAVVGDTDELPRAPMHNLYPPRQEESATDHDDSPNDAIEVESRVERGTTAAETRRVGFEEIGDESPSSLSGSTDDAGKTGQGREVLSRGTPRVQRRKSAVELWEEVNIEVDMITERTMRRLEYIEWPRGRLFQQVLRRDHPLLSIFILNPVLTAVQRTLVFGGILLGLVMVSAAFYRYGGADKTEEEVLFEMHLGRSVSWPITVRQLAVFVWAVFISKPVPIIMYMLFRKGTPVIAPAVKRGQGSGDPSYFADGQPGSEATPPGPATLTQRFFQSFRPAPAFHKATHKAAVEELYIREKRRRPTDLHYYTESAFRHSDIFPLEKKLKRIEIWRRRETVGYTLAFAWWAWCIYFIVAFVFSSRLAEMGEDEVATPEPIYRDFMVTALIDLIGHLLLQPILHFLVVACLVGSVIKTGLLDGFIAAFPRYLDFSFAGARSIHELTIQLHVIMDTHIIGWGLLGFAGLSVDPFQATGDLLDLGAAGHLIPGL